jgi:F0F1-type ATP synthase assembly protein I
MAQILRQAAPFMAAVWVLTGAVLLLGLGGRWLDARFGTGPWLTTIGLFAGVVVGMYELARVALRSGPPPRGRP